MENQKANNNLKKPRKGAGADKEERNYRVNLKLDIFLHSKLTDKIN